MSNTPTVQEDATAGSSTVASSPPPAPAPAPAVGCNTCSPSDDEQMSAEPPRLDNGCGQQRASTTTATTADASTELRSADTTTHRTSMMPQPPPAPPATLPPFSPPAGVQFFNGQWDDTGVFVYQAFDDAIADYAIENQRLGGPAFNPKRMTWIKPSFGWVLYRSGYGSKHGQRRVLKLKLTHDGLAQLLNQCSLVDTNKATRGATAMTQHEDASGSGRVQWDPERDMLTADGKEPRQMLRRRAIQIGLAGKLSEQYVASVVGIEDVTPLAHAVCAAHRAKRKAERDALSAAVAQRLPEERPYLPQCPQAVLTALAMAPGAAAEALARTGRGMAA